MQYKIEGTPLPVVTCTLNSGESMITERGSMSWMSPNMRMETTSNGGFGKALGRMFSGEALFQNRYTAQGGEGFIAFKDKPSGKRGGCGAFPYSPFLVYYCVYLAHTSRPRLTAPALILGGFFWGSVPLPLRPVWVLSACAENKFYSVRFVRVFFLIRLWSC